MKKKKIWINNLLRIEIIKYIIAGVFTTIVYLVSRFVLFEIINIATISAIVSNIIAIVFAFFINDNYVFNQKKSYRFKRFLQFFIARLFTLILDSVLAFIFVETYPEIIGRFVNYNLSMVNTIETLASQISILILNYLLSKLFIFKKQSSS